MRVCVHPQFQFMKRGLSEDLGFTLAISYVIARELAKMKAFWDRIVTSRAAKHVAAVISIPRNAMLLIVSSH